jgi:hypothetical protein
MCHRPSGRNWKAEDEPVNEPNALRAALDRFQFGALIAGAIGLVLCVIGAIFDHAQFFQSYLFAFLFWLGIALGSAASVMTYQLVKGAWGAVSRRVFEAAAATVPLLIVLFIPLLFGLRDLYPWTRPDEAAKLGQKTLYLNVPFFIVRAAIYFAIWLLIAYLLNRWSSAQDQTYDTAPTRRLRTFSAPGLILYVLTISFAAVDWEMSLEPDWFSTVYGMLIVASQVLSALAFVILALLLLARYSPLRELMTDERYNDLGSLLLTFVMGWAYLAFSQFLVIWTGNLPDENSWYLHRSANGWKWIVILDGLVHFALPFALLLFRQVRHKAKPLATVAIILLAVHLLDQFWLVTPAFHPTGFHLHWLDIAAPIGVGGVWLAAFAWRLKQRPIVAVHDPVLPEAVAQARGEASA